MVSPDPCLPSVVLTKDGWSGVCLAVSPRPVLLVLSLSKGAESKGTAEDYLAPKPASGVRFPAIHCGILF